MHTVELTGNIDGSNTSDSMTSHEMKCKEVKYPLKKNYTQRIHDVTEKSQNDEFSYRYILPE